jgi:murein DD-endopeptidase MepM/ murein hydrolase activator NlpD
MQIIIISPNNTSHRHWQVSPKNLFMFAGFSVLLLMASFIYINQQFSFSSRSTVAVVTSHIPSRNEPSIVQQEETGLQDYYAKRLGQLQAESIRLTALTEKLAEIAGVDVSEFQLNTVPAQGGIDENGESLTSELFKIEMSQLTSRFDEQNKQLATIQNLFLTRDSITSAIPQGRPIAGGWLSSSYGYRIDPFNGKKTFHSGIDFAAKEGTNVIAVADGIVSFIGERRGYGELIELDHGNGYVTRYAHNEKIIVKTGDRIKKGEAVALLGSTGRSTGPHVHFEVLREGTKIDPYKFVNR